jgi:hypothetical protein
MEEYRKDVPLILINFKKLSGMRVLELIGRLNETCAFFRDRYEIVFAIRPCDVDAAARNTDVPLYIHDIGAERPLHELFEGKTFEESWKVSGMLINHPENRLSGVTLERNNTCARRWGWKTIIASLSIEEALVLNQQYMPDYISIESADLIGKNISLSEQYPDLVRNATSRIANRVLFGAGIRKSCDVDFVVGGGGAGLMLASAVVGVDDPSKALTELLGCEVRQT